MPATFNPALILALGEHLDAADLRASQDPDAPNASEGYRTALSDALALLRESVASAARLITMNRATTAVTDFDHDYARALSDVAHLLDHGTLPAPR